MTLERTPAERKFLAGIVESIAPGWRIRVTDDGSIAGLDAGIYLLDTQTLWCGMSFLRSADLASMREAGRAGGVEAPEFSAHASRLMAERQEREAAREQAAKAAGSPLDLERWQESEKEKEHDLYLSAAAGLVCSRTADIVLETTGGLAGHWLFIRYVIEGEPGPSRPMYAAATGSRRLLSPEEVRAFAAIAMQQDLANPRSAVRTLIGNRRPRIHPFFEAVAPAAWIDRTAPLG